MAPRSYDFFNFPIFSGRQEDVLMVIHEWIRQRKTAYICVTGAQGIVWTFLRKEVMRAHKEATLVVPDGMPLVWIGRLLGTPTRRIYGPDLMHALCFYSARHSFRIYLYGTTDPTLKKLVQALRHTYKNIRIVGTYAPPFVPLTSKEQRSIADHINKEKPDIIFVGLSTPKQEMWMSMMRSSLRAPALIGVGAAFDFLAGNKRQAPAWMRSLGLEWLFRLLVEPRRLFLRYTFGNILFVGICIWYMIKRVYRAVFPLHS